jgi:hypothetical protein
MDICKEIFSIYDSIRVIDWFSLKTNGQKNHQIKENIPNHKNKDTIIPTKTPLKPPYVESILIIRSFSSIISSYNYQATVRWT